MPDAPQRPSPPARRRPVFDTGFFVVLALAITGGTLTLWLKGPAAFWHVIRQDFGFLIGVLPKVAAGIVIAVLLPRVVRPEMLNRWVGPEQGLTGLALAAAFGAAAPGGPSVVMPLAMGLLAAGADRGAVGAFFTGWSMLSLNRTLVWEMSFLPHDLVALRVALSLPMPVLVGLLMRRATLR